MSPSSKMTGKTGCFLPRGCEAILPAQIDASGHYSAIHLAIGRPLAVGSAVETEIFFFREVGLLGRPGTEVGKRWVSWFITPIYPICK